MNDHIRKLLTQITALEADLRDALREQESYVLSTMRDKKVDIEASVKVAQEHLKKGLPEWLIGNRPRNLITGPIIYSLIIPLLILDVCVSFYQVTCFPIYRIAKVRRSDYIVLDRQRLASLNFVEKFHCTYCAYGAGLIAYVAEITARTEQYFCPIKHARKVLGRHSRYAHFLEYGEASDLEHRIEAFRVALEAIEKPGS